MRWWHYNQGIWRLRGRFQRHCLSLFLGIIGTLAVLAMWQHLLKHEHLYTHALVHQEAITIQTELNQELSTRVLTLEQMATRWQVSGGTSKVAWVADATQYIKDFGGYQAIEWVDSSFHVRWIVPEEGNEAVQNLDLNQDPHQQNALRIARELRQPFLTHTISLVQGGKGFAANIPIFIKQRFDGFIVGVFWESALFDSILSIPEGYHVHIYDHGKLIYNSGGTRQTPFLSSVAIEAYGVDWQVNVFPTPALVAQKRSLLPEVILWGGLAIVWTLAFTVSLKRKATRQVQQIRRINQQLQDEIVHRQQVEASLQQLVNHINVGFVVHATDTHILECNTTACELLGLSTEQMLGKAAIDPAWCFVREDGTLLPIEEFPVNLVLSTQSSFRNYVLGINREDQSRVWVLVTAFPEFDINQQIKQVVVTFIDISRLKRAETELREMTEVMENAISGISKLDTQGYYLYVNKAYADIMGYLPEEMIGMSCQRTVHPDDLEQASNAYQQMIQDGKVELEARGIRKDGSRFYKQIVMISTYDKHQQFVGHYCFLKDISDRKQAEEALEQELLRSKMLFNTSIDGVVILNHQGNVAQTSPSFAHMLGYTVEETLTLNVVDWDAQWTREELQEILGRDILPPIFETRHRRKDGSIYDTEISYSRVLLNGETMHFCICRDISERKQAEIALQNSQARFAGILEIASDAIISVNIEQKITLFNKGAERIFGYLAEEVLGQPLTLLMPDRFAQAHGHHVNQYAHSGSQARQMAQRGAIFGRRKDGTEFPAEASIAKLNLNGEIIFTTFLRDISERVRHETERQRAEEVLRQSEEKFRMAIDFTYNWEYWQAPDGSFVYVSPSCERITGYSPAEFIEDPHLIQAIVHPDDASIFAHHVCDSQLESASVEFRIVTRSNEVRWIAHVCQPVFSNAGEYLGKRASNRDIGERVRLEAERQQSEQALRESEATKQAIIQAIPDLLIRMHSNGDYIEFISNNHFNIINSAQVRQDVNVYDVLPSNLAQLRMQYAELALESNTTQIYDHEIVIEGQQCYEEVRIVPLLRDEVLVMVRDVTDRKQSEIALQLSQERLQLALEASGDGLWDWKIATGEVYYSPQYMTMLGYEADELPLNFSTWEYLTHPDDQPWVLDILNVHMKDNSHRYAFDYRLRTKSGGWKWVADYGKVVDWDEQGNPSRMIGTHRDVNDRKQAEIAFQESAAREQAISQVIQQMRQSLSLKKIFKTTTQELRRVLNCDRVLVYRFNPDWSGAVVAESVGSGWVSVIETLINKDASFGSHTLDRDRCIIKRWDSREAETIDTYVQETQGSIYHQGTRYLSVADIYQSGFEGCYVEFLEKFQARAYLTVPIFSNNKLWGLLASYQNSKPREWRDSEIQVSEQIVTQLGMAIHQAELFAQVQRQSKELRQAMEAAEAANLAKSMFLANMSHELRTPLNVILGFAQVMSHDSSLTPTQQEDLQTIRRSSDHLLSLINDVLDLSKIESGHSTLEESGFDLISLLHTLRTMMSERVAVKQLQLTFDIAPEVPQFVIADEQKLRQVILNLLSNAIKFTKQGSVTLRVTSLESSQKTCLVPDASQYVGSFKHPISTAACILQFEVSDTGVGIAATEQEAIFDAFMQADAGRKSTGGTGLGLTISRKLLELMNGSISVESTPGVGSTFTVTVPVCPTSGVDGQVERQERTIIGLVPGQSHRRILVVDDQLENRTLMVRLLTRLGLEVQEATDGQEAIALWQQWHPDLTWMDIRMPGLDGYEATKQIRAMEQEQASIIIALTAQASQSDRALALAAGCNDYISKPFREETLFLKLKEYLGLKYLYAESETLPSSLPISSPNTNADYLPSFEPVMMTQLPTDWLENLEDLALCGNDRAIIDLAHQLAPEFENFKTQLLDLANRFEFEQIVHLIHRGSSS